MAASAGSHKSGSASAKTTRTISVRQLAANERADAVMERLAGQLAQRNRERAANERAMDAFDRRIALRSQGVA